MEKHNIEIFKKINELVELGKEFVLATIIDASVGTPGRLGFKMIIDSKGNSFGTVGGGELEFQTSIEMKNILTTEKKSKIIKYSLTPDLKMACGGKVKIFIEYFPSAKRAWLFGAGHMGVSLTPILSSLGFRVTLIDNREDYALKERFKDANVIHKDFLEFTEEFNPSKNDSIIIFTYGHEYDYDILNILAKKNVDVKYLGVIGAKSKVKKIKKKIKAFEYGDLIDNIYAPIGLNIARRTTPEIAVAIAAEIIAVYNGVEDIKMMSKK